MENKCETHRVFSLLISSVQRMKKNLHLRKKLYFVYIPSEILVIYKCLFHLEVFYPSHFPISFVESNLNSCKSTVFFRKKKPKNFFLLIILILTIFKRIFCDRPQFTDQRRQNPHLLRWSLVQECLATADFSSSAFSIFIKSPSGQHNMYN